MKFKLVGNKVNAAALIFVFIVLLCLLSWRCSHAAEIALRSGVSFGPGGNAPVLGLDLRLPQPAQVDLYAGTLLWGETRKAPTNWDWHLGFRTCRWHFCASLCAAYVQRIDTINGSHANFGLGLTYLIGWHRLESIGAFHLSNAGTSEHNQGRNAALVDITLQ